jgi:hypothetical protein
LTINRQQGEPEHTHKAIMTVYSNGPNDDISVQIKWDPDLGGIDISVLGYLPAAYQLIEAYILPALEEAYLSSEDVAMQRSPPTSSVN